jgi:hypothetical protein
MRTAPCDRRSRRRFDAPRDDRGASLERLATDLGDAVERIVRSLDPNAARSSGDDLFGDVFAAPEPCRRCGRSDCCPTCCRPHHDDRHHHDHHDHHDHHHHGCDCCAPRCGPDPCHCSCCIGDADVVVYTRVGETRVVPINIENHRKRERNISLDLGEFRTKGGSDSPVTGRLVTPSEFVLGPCAEHEAILVVQVGSGDAKPSPQPQPQPGPGPGVPIPGTPAGDVDIEEKTKAELLDIARELGVTGASSMTKAELAEALARTIAERDDVPSRNLPDVDDCHVAVADLCIRGCDVRPVRIAVAVLPRDCNTYDIHCDCACC